MSGEPTDDRDAEVIRDLTASIPDFTAATIRILASSAGPAGALIAEVFTTGIGRQRDARLREFLLELSRRVQGLTVGVAELKTRIADPEWTELLAQAGEAAARDASGKRRERLAKLAARGLTTEERTADETKKLLYLLESLTDSEVIWLIHLSHELAHGETTEHFERNRATLAPASKEHGLPLGEREHAALQDGYLVNLQRLGLLEDTMDLAPHIARISELGKMLVRHIQTDLEESEGEGHQ